MREAKTFYRTFVSDVHEVRLVAMYFLDHVVGHLQGLDLLHIFNFEVADDGKVFDFVSKVIDLRRLAIELYFKMIFEISTQQLIGGHTVFGFDQVQGLILRLLLDGALKVIDEDAGDDLEGLIFFVVFDFRHGYVNGVKEE